MYKNQQASIGKLSVLHASFTYNEGPLFVYSPEKNNKKVEKKQK